MDYPGGWHRTHAYLMRVTLIAAQRRDSRDVATDIERRRAIYKRDVRAIVRWNMNDSDSAIRGLIVPCWLPPIRQAIGACIVIAVETCARNAPIHESCTVRQAVRMLSAE